MTCAFCGAENRSGRKFCARCGRALALACSSCGAANEPGELFCGECGSPLEGAAVLATTTGPVGGHAAPIHQPLMPEAERRLVSVLFADLVGFTTLSESRDAEEVRDLLTRYFDTARRIIARYGGTIEKFIGDAVMAVWGAPVANEDDAERAVRAALDLTQAVAALGVEVGATGLNARAGVLTGEAAVTIGAEGQGMVAGDLVNTASRIQSVAEPGTVLVGEATRRASEAAIAFEDAGSHELKGKTEALRLWRAMRVVAAIGGARRSVGLEPPFVGRDRDIRLLKELFHTSAEEHRAHLVSVIGIGGIGKSRLAWEFDKYIDGLADTVWWHRGRCLAYGEGVTYWALAEMVRMRARITEGEEATAAAAKLHSTVELHLSDPEEQRWVEPRLAHLIGLEERTAPDQQDLFAAWRLFFERMAEKDPVALLFEDMQWADSALLDFVEYLLEWSKDHSLFVLTLARPEVMEKRPNWGAGKRNFNSMFLEPLSAAAMRELLEGLVPGLPDQVRMSILDRAEGVPLYAVETVRMLLDRGLLVEEGSRYRPAGPIETLEVPESLHGLIAARLDGLESVERRFLQDASVLGKVFTKESASILTGLPEGEVEPILTSLVRKEFLSVQIDPRSPEHGQYGFLQDLVRRVAYETLSKKDRKARHLATARHFEERWGADVDEIIEVVASHYLDAFDAAPDAPDAPEIKSKARDMLVRAGERAASLAASDEAQRYFERAAGLSGEPADRAHLLERAGEMAWVAGRMQAAKLHFEGAIALFDDADSAASAARVSARLADVVYSEGRIDEAIARMERALEVLSAAAPDEDQATLLAEMARMYWFVGNTQRSEDLIEVALALAETLWLPEVLAHGMVTKGSIMYSKRRIEEAEALLERALKLALEYDVASAALRSYNNLTEFTAQRDRYENAVQYAEDGLALSRRLGNRRWEVPLLSVAFYPLTLLGRWDDVLTRGAEILGMDETAVRVGDLSDLLFMATIHNHRGEHARAKELLSLFAPLGEGEDIQSRVGHSALTAELLRADSRPADALRVAASALEARGTLGLGFSGCKEAFIQGLEAAFDLGDEGEAERLLASVEGLRPGEIPPYIRAHLSRFRARLAILQSRNDEVEPGFKAGAGMFREIAVPFWLAVTLLEHGEWLVGGGRLEESEPLLEESLEIFGRLGARPWLERVERVSSRIPSRSTVGA